MFVRVWVNHLNEPNVFLNVDNNQFYYHIICVIWLCKADYPLMRIYTNVDFKSEDFNIERRDNVNSDRRTSLRIRFYHMSVFSSTFHYIL